MSFPLPSPIESQESLYQQAMFFYDQYEKVKRVPFAVRRFEELAAPKYQNFSYGWGNGIGGWVHAWNSGRKDLRIWTGETLYAALEAALKDLNHELIEEARDLGVPVV